MFVGVLVEHVHPLLIRGDGLDFALEIEVLHVGAEEVPLVVRQGVVVDEEAIVVVAGPHVQQAEARLGVACGGDDVAVLAHVVGVVPLLAARAVEDFAGNVVLLL